jgi:predicted metal-dependent peptidase
MDQALCERMKAAQERLIEEHAWWGMLSLKLEFIEDEAVKTAATNGKWLKYAPSWVGPMAEKQMMREIAHETGHPALLHLWRMEGKDPVEFNIAADYVIDTALFKDGLYPEFQVIPEYEGLSAEAIYELRMKQKREEQAAQQGGGQGDDQGDESEPQSGGDEGEDEEQDSANQDSGDQDSDDQEPGDQEPGDEPGDQESEGQDSEPGEDGEEGDEPGEDSDQATDQAGDEGDQDSDQAGEGQGEAQDFSEIAEGMGDKSYFVPGEGEEEEEENQELEWMLEAQVASMAARKAGQMGGDTERAMVESRRPAEDWRTELADFIVTNLPSDYAWTQPNRRFIHQGIYLPGMQRENTPGFAFAIDTSGSIDPELLGIFGTQCCSIFTDVRPEWVAVAYVDTEVNRTEHFGPEDELQFHAKGYGGTAFAPAFEWASQLEQEPAALIYFTDLYAGDWPLVKEPNYPVLWVVPAYSKDVPVPFGRKVVISKYS